ncbi:16S rRNA (uracil(1498)-N(3))-methyltransferase [Nonlabens arenilitoris]|uniref:Ribosomal RNA small subunit methyltransferase E n=1 Tax=Nonlabens arenilitoris TaxID=1217969 RepID=A0A2S7U7D1_9FLAO|nr:16S rRNA (uracil(1498)-N(3))-methyltransferase [Nonlabens arenilitoris]PQJ30457.1 16S rRNA (uracil(1498)-N(3))-methyltransferase [Nonlabens arenilitoris]
MQLFYNSQINKQSISFTLDREESKHVFKVLRKNIGDRINLTDGKGNLYHGTINHITSNRCDLDIAFAEAYPPLPYQLHIAIAPTKMNDRMEWFLEKATEMGITRITPILCKHSERQKINLERFDRIIISAMKQSLQFHKPVLDELTSFEDFLSLDLNNSKLIAHCEDGDKNHLKNLISKGTSTTVLIGPEGDFTPQEIDQALKNNFKPVSLGTTRLRTETAGVYTAATLNIINN